MDETAKQSGGKFGDYVYPRRERSTADLLKDIVANIQEIIRSEVRLATAEVKEETGKVFTASRLLLIGAVMGMYAAGFLLLAGVYALATLMSWWLAALLVGVALALIAGMMVMAGRGRLRNVSPKPEKTMHSVKENVEWMKTQLK
jgi:Protein of unknown function (DUF1469).